MTATIAEPTALESYVDRLARQAQRERTIPEELTKQACRATLRRFAHVSGRLVTSDHARIRAYFWGVVRRSCIRSRSTACSDTRALYRLLSIAEDLESAGRTSAQILSELEWECARELSDPAQERFRALVRA